MADTHIDTYDAHETKWHIQVQVDTFEHSTYDTDLT